MWLDRRNIASQFLDSSGGFSFSPPWALPPSSPSKVVSVATALPDNDTRCDFVAWAAAVDAVSSERVSDYTFRLYLLPPSSGGGGCTWLGIAYVGCSAANCRSFVRAEATEIAFVVNHELGHSMSMRHAGSDDDGDGVVDNPYGDASCIMSNVLAWRRFHAVHQFEAGWLRQRDVAWQAGGTVTLVSSSLTSSAARAVAGGVRLVRLVVDGDYYWISLRTQPPTTYDAGLVLSPGLRGEVFLHRWRDRQPTVLLERAGADEALLGGRVFVQSLDAATHTAVVVVGTCVRTKPLLSVVPAASSSTSSAAASASVVLPISACSSRGVTSAQLQLRVQTAVAHGCDDYPVTTTLAPTILPSGWSVTVCVHVAVSLTADSFPTETSWTLAREQDPSTVLLWGTASAADTTSVATVRLCEPVGTRLTFTIVDSFGDGLCCSLDCSCHGGYEVSFDGTVVARGMAFDSSATHSLVVGVVTSAGGGGVAVLSDVVTDVRVPLSVRSTAPPAVVTLPFVTVSATGDSELVPVRVVWPGCGAFRGPSRSQTPTRTPTSTPVRTPVRSKSRTRTHTRAAAGRSASASSTRTRAPRTH
jgi:hypothetical protein